MANEITPTLALAMLKGPISESFSSNVPGGGNPPKFDMAGSRMSHNVQAHTVAPRLIELGELTAPQVRWAFMKNLAPAGGSQILLAMDAGVAAPFAKLPPAAAIVLPLVSGAVYARTEAGAANLEIGVFEA